MTQEIVVYIIIVALIVFGTSLVLAEYLAARRRRKVRAPVDALPTKGEVDPRFTRRGRITNVLVRDYQPPPSRWHRLLLHALHIRRIKPAWTSFAWTPFGQDGKLRGDLMAVVQVDGKWVPNPWPNDGFYPLGTMREDDE